jgi:hypothetical protein
MGLFGGCGNNNDSSWIWIIIIVVFVLCFCNDGNSYGGNNCCENEFTERVFVNVNKTHNDIY